MLRLVVRRGLFDEDQARGMLQSPHSGFHVHAGVGVPEDDRAFAVGVEQVTHRSDKTAGPTAVAGPPSPARKPPALDGIARGGDTCRTYATHDAEDLVALARFLPRWAGVRIV